MLLCSLPWRNKLHHCTEHSHLFLQLFGRDTALSSVIQSIILTGLHLFLQLFGRDSAIRSVIQSIILTGLHLLLQSFGRDSAISSVIQSIILTGLHLPLQSFGRDLAKLICHRGCRRISRAPHPNTGWSIDLSINGLYTENRIRSQRTSQPYKIKVNNFKLIDLVIRVELTQAILMLRFSNFLRNSIVHFCMYSYLGTYFLRVAVSLLCRLKPV